MLKMHPDVRILTAKVTLLYDLPYSAGRGRLRP